MTRYLAAPVTDRADWERAITLLIRVTIKRPRPLPEHGTLSRYQRGCSCDACRRANAASVAQRKARAAGTAKPWMHGRLNTYNYYACRCEACCQANRDYQTAYRQGRQP